MTGGEKDDRLPHEIQREHEREHHEMQVADMERRMTERAERSKQVAEDARQYDAARRQAALDEVTER